jgi:hypothetical protein
MLVEVVLGLPRCRGGDTRISERMARQCAEWLLAVPARNSPESAVVWDDTCAEDDDGDGDDPGQEVGECQPVDDVLA